MANNYNRSQDKVTGKLILQGKIKNTSPLLIGKGNGDEADTEVMLWPDGNPYIPAASLVGALRALYVNTVGKIDGNKAAEEFWGSREMIENGKPRKGTVQSHLIVDDLTLEESSNGKVVIRDGVSINPKTGIAFDKGKYDYQLVEPEAEFNFRAEVTIRDKTDADDMKSFLRFIGESIQNEHFRIGALTNFGFGKIEFTEYKAWSFQFPGNVEDWFNYLEGKQHDATAIFIDENCADELLLSDALPANTFHIKATFQLKSALITGTYGTDANAPDKAQLKSGENFVLSGKSIKGAIRHGALKILNTVMPNAEKGNHSLLDHVFGWVNNEDQKDEEFSKQNSYAKNAIKSRLRIEESNITKAVKPMTQDRIKIDRFTGGVLGNAKFDSQPVWKNGETGFELQFLIQDYKPWEAALLLHLLKDLWTEDLPIGGEKNVGRGILVGQSAEINWKNEKGELKEAKLDKDGFGEADVQKLGQFDKAWTELINQSEKAEA
jgi:CRISPR/Cas system CSM-associated protein Csm3 (group 7 of RAMP superfamily)